MINSKKKSDFSVGQFLFYLESTRDKENSFNRKDFRIEIKKLVITKIGREYVYFENSRYKIGSDYTEYFWGRGEWRNDTKISRIFETWTQADNEISRLDTIKRLSSSREIQEYLEKFSQNILNLMESELNERIPKLGE